ncbi:hypothetical protein [Thiohalobacter sp.]|uniref:hypothetical protein n=1 Tax=Thiohalobacter sp. TaxID=2025948 RepID=UPI0026197A0A|nr:hypothetical protein [Thiohalobacter sp.]
MFSDLIAWLKDNWHEESNIGKAKLAGLALLVFLLFAALLPSGEAPPAAGGDGAAPADTGSQAVGESAPEPTAAAQAADAYRAYEARIAELEREKAALEKEASQQAAEAYRSYEARIGELERERESLAGRMADIGPVEEASKEAADAYRAYEARIAQLEREKESLEREAARQAAEAYRNYEARIAELEREREVLAEKAAELDRAEAEAAETYRSYESRVAELERENEALRKRIRELEAAAGGTAAAPAVDPDLRLRLEALRGTLDDILATLPPAD